MKYLTDEQLQKLTPQRRSALLKSVKARLFSQTDDYGDFEPDQLTDAEKQLNDYRKKIKQMVQNDIAKDGHGSF